MTKILTYFTVLCTILICTCKFALSQTSEIKGVVNVYAKVEAINGNTVTLKTDASLLFKSANLPDTVLLIQMTGITQDEFNRPININNAGKYEFNIVTGFNGRDVTLKSQISANTFTTAEIVQMIRVPSYKNAEIVDVLRCEPWNWEAGTGGVLAFMVDNTLTFNSDIDVSGLGFRGGDKSLVDYTYLCEFSGEYALPDYPASASNRAGNKGEGAVTTSYFNPGFSTNNVRGFGRTANGGGGGNGQWSGGGGGGNGSYGGVGGIQSCGEYGSMPDGFVDVEDEKIPIGNNGFPIVYSGSNVPSKHVFMGGGGGAGTGKGTAGGNGGGIVIIAAAKLKFSQNTAIKANGESVDDAPAKAGAGGGGAGGSVMLSVKDYDDNSIRVELTGGKGGNVDGEGFCKTPNYSQGTGGGGSGGTLYATKDDKNWYSNNDRFRLAYINSATSNKNNGIIINSRNGCTDSNPSGNQSFTGVKGVYFGNYQIQLNGFFHNYVFDSDIAACYDEPVNISASEPKGGTGTYSYSWQMSPNGRDGWAEISQTSNLSYLFKENTYVRRIVTSGGITDESLPVPVTVYKPNTNRIATLDGNTYCGKQALIIENVEIKSVPGESYDIQWQLFYGGEWHNIVGNESLTTQLPEVETTQTYRYRRMITSSRGCVSYAVTSDITVIPAITGNTITPEDQEICEGDAMILRGERTVTGGNGADTYEYQWQIRDSNSTWKDISDATTGDFLPVLHLQGFGDSYYRRRVKSGNCESFSEEVTVRCDIFIPNGFSPDGNGINECFRILNVEKAANSELIILDRYNNVVFKSNSIHKNSTAPGNCEGWWKGLSLTGKELPEGTYYYQLTLDGKFFKGYVVLKR